MSVKAVAEEELGVSGYSIIIGIITDFQRIYTKVILIWEETPSCDMSPLSRTSLSSVTEGLCRGLHVGF